MMPKKQMAGSGAPPARGNASAFSATPSGACAPQPPAGSPAPAAAHTHANTCQAMSIQKNPMSELQVLSTLYEGQRLI